LGATGADAVQSGTCVGPVTLRTHVTLSAPSSGSGPGVQEGGIGVSVLTNPHVVTT
jgi:hypothetical protein